MRATAIKLHRILALVGGLALFAWGISGLFHIVMSTFGPQQAVFFPPSRALELADARPLHDTLSAAGIEHAAAVRITPSYGENLLQVTEDPEQPRRYFRLRDGAELEDHDEKHAIFLARHYTKEEAPIASVEWIDEFTPAYPWVNRLLPVYKVSFKTPDDFSIYIYTETNAAAGVNNNMKEAVQTGFRWLHTWSWFPHQAEWGRVILITLALGALTVTVIAGIFMLVLIKRKTRAPGMRGWHRIAGYALALPMLMFTTSGLFHLIEYAGQTPGKSLTLSAPIDLATADYPVTEQWEELTQGLNVAGLSLIEDANGEKLYRLGLARERHGGPATASQIRNARFDGVERTGPALYINAATGAVDTQGDKEIALQLAEKFTGAPREAIIETTLITRFGAGYDFRNKRLPVWKIAYGEPVNAAVFIDTTTGVLADVTPDGGAAERWSFSMLHKWDFLRPLGRTPMNLIIASIVIACLGFLAGIGLVLDQKRRARRPARRRAPSPTGAPAE